MPPGARELLRDRLEHATALRRRVQRRWRHIVGGGRQQSCQHTLADQRRMAAVKTQQAPGGSEKLAVGEQECQAHHRHQASQNR
jgi:hypothetical protein